MNELGNTPADKDYKPSEIVNDLAEEQVKAVQLMDGTYITEKLAKSMTKAEERALETYPHFTAENITEVTNARYFFAKGYKQAEKDLALTWRDMQRIWQIIDIAYEECDEHEPSWMYGSEPFFSEVLKRFEEEKENTKTK